MFLSHDERSKRKPHQLGLLLASALSVASATAEAPHAAAEDYSRAVSIVERCGEQCREVTHCTHNSPLPSQRACYLAAACTCKCTLDNVINAGIPVIEEDACKREGKTVQQCLQESSAEIQQCVVESIRMARALESDVPVVPLD